ncbi:hypothetical protein [Xanthomonas vesicatoria]|uniref:Uncharacterized protein n=1 Tax=Xanthomonas vesicatoria TaxID=56460 RepID=A0AAJ0J0T0_9XANT|nr:hypothetical protein [Xanthomonas vesicatoria]APO97498.1 hypothetical protein BI313_19880 [Xanthomonas vesicatoria]APP77950.1 hypothetical protein BJD12_16960 [Xanthomonas vesicatoria ATCC 35937]KHM92770.1 hypothetical protein OR60_15615 [Xanthomonas vesicatoria]KHM97296.1 hypothetical protein OR61_04175 [Xanthomonas vesicatoria]KTF34819.1 hypothetical protein LMG920_04910 [Xanthomonas vesicatoria]
MQEQEMDVIAQSLGRIWVALARSVGDLALALAEQPGMDGSKLLSDFAARLPSGQDDGTSKVFEAIRRYIDQGAAPRAE